MSRVRFDLPDGRFVVAGRDEPMGTWFAQLYDEGQDPNEAPAAAIGYHPSEAAIGLAERPGMRLGPYPVRSLDELLRLVEDEWGEAIQ